MNNSIAAPPYHDRKTWLIEVREVRGWKLKVYGILAPGRELTSPVVEAGIHYAAENVAWPNKRTGFGFVTFHSGEEAIWLLVDLWMDDIMRHFIFSAPTAEPKRFQAGPSDGTNSCVWELEVVKHERDAWVKNALSCPAEPNYEGYLTDALEIAVP